MNKEAKRLNADLGNSSLRLAALPKLKELIENQNEAILSENVINWLQTLHQILTLNRNELAGTIFSEILSQANQVPFICRDISSKFIPSLLDEFLSIADQDTVIMKVIRSIVTHFPTSCGIQRASLLKMTTLIMMTTKNEPLFDSASRCWALSSFLGGGGHQRSNHRSQWFGQLNEAIDALRFAIECFSGDNEGKGDPTYESVSLTFLCLPMTEPERSDALIQRISVTCRCIVRLMEIDSPMLLPYPVDAIVRLIQYGLDIVPSQMGNTTEMVYRAENLLVVHEETLSALGTLTKICRRNLCRYSSEINSTFSALLDLWKDKSPIPGCNKKYCVVQEKIYITIMDWVQNCGTTTRFMCGNKVLNHSFLRHIIDAIKPIASSAILTKQYVGGGGKKAKRQRLEIDGNHGDQIMSRRANDSLTSSALKVVIATIEHMSHRIPEEVARCLQQEIVVILTRLQTAEEIIPYFKCVEPRLMLYKALLSFTLNPSECVAPPTEVAVKIFSSALWQEQNPHIRNFCQEGLSSLNNIIHPWRHAWHMSVPTQGVASFPVEVTAPLIEPMNVPHFEDMLGDEISEKLSESPDHIAGTPPVHIKSPRNGKTDSIDKMSTKFDKHDRRSPDIIVNSVTITSDDVPQTSEPDYKNGLAPHNQESSLIGQESIEDQEMSEIPANNDTGIQSSSFMSNVTSLPLPEMVAGISHIPENNGISDPLFTTTNGTEEYNNELKDMINDFVDASPDHE